MASGSCSCGNIQLTLTGKPSAIGLCHCVGCRKVSGSPFTYNFIVKSSDVKITNAPDGWSPKEVAREADSGNAVRNYFCPNCGSPLYGGTLSPDGELETYVIRCGIFDDIALLHNNPPTVEIYTSQRLKWIAPIEGCLQIEGMPTA